MTKDDVFLVTADGTTALNPSFVSQVSITKRITESGATVYRVTAWFKGTAEWSRLSLTEETPVYGDAAAVWKRASAIVTSPSEAIYLTEEESRNG